MEDRQELPFYDDPWDSERIDAARAIWDWHVETRRGAEQGETLEEEDFEIEAGRVRSQMATRLVSEDTQARARAAAEQWNLSPELFAVQVSAAYTFAGPARFANQAALYGFSERWALPVGRLLIALAGSDRMWQVPWVDALSKGFFLLSCLLNVGRDVKNKQVFFPEDEMSFFGVEAEALRDGPPGDNVRKLLWKQSVRIRDQFAQALPLSRELPRRQAASFRRWWLGGLEMLNAIERRQYDLWSGPVELSVYHRAQVRYQARFGRLTFKAK